MVKLRMCRIMVTGTSLHEQNKYCCLGYYRHSAQYAAGAAIAPYGPETQSIVAVGEHGNRLVMIPYVESDTEITPVTIHAITRQQIKFRLNTGRLTYE